MCNICKDLLKGKLSFPEARSKLPKLIDLETVSRRKKHYKELYEQMEKAYQKVFDIKKEKK